MPDSPALTTSTDIGGMDRPTGPVDPTRGLARWALAVPLVAVAALHMMLGFDGAGVFVSLLCLATLWAVAVAPASPSSDSSHTGFSVVALIPVGFLIATGMAIGVSTITGIGGRGWTDGGGYALALWLISLAIPLIVSLRRSGRVDLVGVDAVGAVGGVLVGLGGVILAIARPFEFWSRMVAGSTDFNRHLVFIRGIVEAGGLAYDQNTYPRGLHALVGMAWAASGGTTYASAWAALESTLWLMTSLIALALGVATVRMLRLCGIDNSWAGGLACTILMLSFIQSMWLTIMFRLGFVTSVLAGMVLTATLMLGTSLGGRWLGTPQSVAWLGVASGLLVQGWTLLVPITAALGGVAVIIALRRPQAVRDSWAAWVAVFTLVLVVVALSLPSMVSLVRERAISSNLEDSLAASGGSGLYAPEFWWGVALGLAAVAVAVVWRRGATELAVQVVVTLGAGIVIVAVVSAAGAGALGALNYYSLKTLWTISVIVPPLAIVGTLWLGFSVARWLLSRPPGLGRTAALAGSAGLVTVMLAAVFGRVVGTPSLVWSGVTEGFAVIPFQIPVVTELEARGIDNADQDALQGALVWGIVPSATPGALPGSFVGMSDVFAQEATAWAALTTLSGGAIAQGQVERNSRVACDYLRANPEAIRLTGPNPQAGAPWLVASGCPEDVVRPADWISVPINDAWFVGSNLADRPYVYPTYDEFQAYLAEQKAQQEAQRNQATPAPSQN